jgi:hypothetical protein
VQSGISENENLTALNNATAAIGDKTLILVFKKVATAVFPLKAY